MSGRFLVWQARCSPSASQPTFSLAPCSAAGGPRTQIRSTAIVSVMAKFRTIEINLHLDLTPYCHVWRYIFYVILGKIFGFAQNSKLSRWEVDKYFLVIFTYKRAILASNDSLLNVLSICEVCMLYTLRIKCPHKTGDMCLDAKMNIIGIYLVWLSLYFYFLTNEKFYGL